jgi:hypothetical protein
MIQQDRELPSLQPLIIDQLKEAKMANDGDKAVDDGVGGFGGEKLRQHQIQENALPDRHANSTGHETSDEKIVAAEFSGLDNDLIDMGSFGEGKPDGDDGLGHTNHDEDKPNPPEALDTADKAVTQYDRSVSEDDVDETAAGGIQFPDDADAEEPSR